MNGGLRAAVMRGGTSKGVFAAYADLPTVDEERDDLVLRIMGGPDRDQIDGLGGGRATTSKFVAVGESTRPGIDLEYAVAAVGVDKPIVDWSGTCGNLTAAVVPFALATGLVERSGDACSLTLLNRSTSRLVSVTVELEAGRARVDGPVHIDGVPTSGSPILCEYLDPAGGVLGAATPTGSVIDEVEVDGDTVPVTILDITHPYAFVPSDVLGPRRTPAEINADDALLDRLERLRGAVAVHLGIVADRAQAATASPSVPRLVVVSVGSTGAPEPAIGGVALSMGRAIETIPVTAALALGAGAAMPGSVPALASTVVPAAGSALRIGHPAGSVDVTARWSVDGRLMSAGIVRTARMLASGHVFPRTGAIA